MAEESKAYTFTEEGARRIIEAVRMLEAQYGNLNAKPRGGNTHLRDHVRGVLTEELTRGESAEMQVTIPNSGETIEIHESSMLSAEVTLPAGCRVEAAFIGGDWYLSAYDCDMEELELEEPEEEEEEEEEEEP